MNTTAARELMQRSTYQSASVNLPGIMSLLVGGGAAACAGVLLLSCRLLLDMMNSQATSKAIVMKKDVFLNLNTPGKILSAANL